MIRMPELDALRQKLQAEIEKTFLALYEGNENQILADASTELEQTAKDATIVIPLTFKVPLEITRNSITFTASLEWELKRKRKDEADQVTLDNNPKLPGIES